MTPLDRARLSVVSAVSILGAYAIECASYYSRYLDAHLVFMPPKRAFAVPDVLGLGFGIPWILFAVAFGAAAACWWKFKATKWSLLLCAIAAFVLISTADFMLYRVLERQVLSM